MTDEAVDSLIDKWKPVLRLAHWEIVWHWDHTEGAEDYADVMVTPGRDSARITLYADSIRTPEELEHSLIHEMVHCVMHPAESAINDLLESLDEAPVAWAKTFGKAYERCVDSIARSFFA